MVNFLKQVKQGDSQAILTLYKKYSPRVISYLEKRLPTKEDAQEICNDVFLEAIDSLPLLRKEENLLAWVLKIAHNNMVDFYRKKKIKSVLLSQVPFLEVVAKDIHQPEFAFEKDKIRDRFENAIHRLSQKYRKIIHLHYEEHVAVKDLAVIFNLSFKATESMLFRARKSFKKFYDNS